MYGSSGKFGRGGASGGRGGGKRTNPLTSSFHSTPPTHRSSSATPNNRISSGSAGHRSRSATPASMASSAPSSTEETFSVETRNPLDFAMIIRLAPDLVEEIKRVEADGGTARIKFDPNANNTSGNVIHVGNKDFRFTWSREMGDLCDIYEERQSGEDGNGLLVESGCAWRKLNVQRVLDESTKNHVKRRSEEAEKKLKSRKAIILDPKNPSMKNQVKALAAAEATQWRKHFKQKEPELKKRKIETPPVNSGPPKSVYKSGLSSSTPSKGRPPSSPLPSPPENPGASLSPFGTRTPAKGPTSVEDVMIQGANQKNIASSDKDTFNRAGSTRERQVDKGNKSVDLQSMLISILKENPKGLSMKLLEKAVGDTIPNSVGKIEPILKKISTYQTPGRYVLKPGIELEDVQKPLSESGSSPKDNRHQAPALSDKRHNILAPLASDKVATEEVAKQAELNSNIGEEFDSLENVDILLDSPPRVDDKKIPERSEGPAGSSSESGSGSDSESESSDSGSDSGSHSRSRSKSGSSSDSDSDASSNSKQGSDEDVDIISDDEKEPKLQMQVSAVGVPISPVPWISEDEPLQNGIDKQDDNESDIVEIEKDLSDDDQGMGISASHLISSKEIEKPTHDVRISSPVLQEMQGSQVYRESLLDERENFAKDGSKLEQANNSERTGKGKSKRSGESKHPIDKSEHTKRLKLGSLPTPKLSQGLLSESSPYRVIEESGNSHPSRALNKTSKNAGDCPGVQKGIDQGHLGKSVLEESSGRRPVETSSSVKALGAAEKPSMAAESFGRGIKYPERNHQLIEGSHVHKDKVPKGVPGDELYTKEKKVPQNSKESSFGDKRSTPVDSYYNGTHGDVGGNIREAGGLSEMPMGYPPKNDNRTGTGRSSSMNGGSKTLQRAHSDLELGEFREPSPEEILGVKKDFARKGSFKPSENKPSTSGFSNSDLSKGRSTGLESGKPPSPRMRAGVSSNPESSFKKRSPEHHADDSTRPYSRAVQNQPPGSQHMSKTDHELGTQKQVDGNSKKASAVAQQQLVSVRGSLNHPTKEVRTHKSSILSDLNDIQKDTSLTGSDDGGLKRRESSSDENSCSYSKYEKDDPEFRGPIRDFTQYKESVQEYREKYDSYCSLNKTLESYRNEFQKLGKDIEIAKARDREKYYHLLGQLKESYRQCGTRHKRLKKIFVVLHEELKHLKQMIKDYALSYSKD